MNFSSETSGPRIQLAKQDGDARLSPITAFDILSRGPWSRKNVWLEARDVGRLVTPHCAEVQNRPVAGSGDTDPAVGRDVVAGQITNVIDGEVIVGQRTDVPVAGTDLQDNVCGRVDCGEDWHLIGRTEISNDIIGRPTG